MSIFYIPKEEIDSIRPLLSKIPEQRVGAEGVCTLAELDPDKKFAGCIQFCIEETGIPEERDHRAVYAEALNYPFRIISASSIV